MDDVPPSLEPKATEATDRPEPPELSAEYHHARRNLNLVSALLFAWEFIGVELGNSEAEISGVKLKLKSPDAAPWVLFVLVLFFGVRFVLEWVQCPPARRQVLAARIDFTLAQMLAGCSVAIFGYQAATHVQIFMQGAVLANVVSGTGVPAIAYGWWQLLGPMVRIHDAETLRKARLVLRPGVFDRRGLALWI